MNELLIGSRALRSRFQLDVLPLKFTRSIKDVGYASARKLAQLPAVWARLIAKCIVRTPNAIYFTLAPTGIAFFRDLTIVAIG